MLARLCLMIGLCLAGSAVGASAGDLTLQVQGARNAKGDLVFCLFAAPAPKFPDCAKGSTFERRVVPAASAGQPVVFSGIAPGRLAVIVLHDENSNRKLDTSLLGVPKEGLAVSNDNLPKFSAPKFAASSFAFSGNAKRTVTLVYW